MQKKLTSLIMIIILIAMMIPTGIYAKNIENFHNTNCSSLNKTNEIQLGKDYYNTKSNTYSIYNGETTVTVAYTDYGNQGGNCWQYAQKFYNKIWGYSFSNQRGTSDDMLRNLSKEEHELNTENLKAYVSQAALGCTLRITTEANYDANNGDGVGHSQIIVQKDNNGFTVFEAGKNSTAWSREHYYTWQEYMDTSWLGGEKSHIKYIKWKNASAFQSYVSQCTSYPCYANVSAKANAKLWTLPCSDSTDSSSVNEINCSSSGEILTATQLLKNTKDNYWYRVSKNSKTYYLYAGNVNSVERRWDVSISNVSVPSSLTVGSSFSIGGTMRTDYLKLTYVSSYVYPGSSTSGTASTGTYEDITANTYSIKGSTLDKGTKFGTLSAGNYTIVFSARAVNCWSNNGSTISTEAQTFTLHSSGFTVSAAAPTPAPTAVPSYTVTFVDWDGTTLKTEYVSYGGNATPPGDPYRQGYTFIGWSGTYTNVTSDRVITAQYQQNTAYLDLNGQLDGELKDGLYDCGTADVYINGTLVADDWNDYWTEWPEGTIYELKDIKPLPGYSYDGVYSGSRQGTIGSNDTSVYLSFSQNNYSSITESPAAYVYSGHTYYYYSTPVTWYFAKEFCESMGGHLATIADADENSFVTSLFEVNSQVWLGATDYGTDNEWRWITGEPFNYSYWSDSEPNNCSSVNSDSEDYLQLYTTGMWNDNNGTAKMGFVLEIDGFPSSMISAPSIYTLSVGTDIWVQWLPINGATHYTVRFFRVGESEECKIITGITDTYVNCHLDDGNYRLNIAAVNGNYENCYAISNYSEVFTVTNRNDSLPYGVRIKDGHLYSLYDYKFGSWEEAKTFCESIGGHLVTITSEEENLLVLDLLANTGYQRCWLGATDIESEGTWKWITGEPFIYSNWDSGEPNNYSSVEHFAEIWAHSSVGLWNDVPFVCPDSCVVVEFEFTDYQPGAFIEYNGAVYYRFDYGIPWYEAGIVSEQLGGHLCTISCNNENQAIMELISGQPGRYFIGATDVGHEGSWVWCNNEDFEFFDSSFSTEDNYLGIENYLEVATDGVYFWWNDCISANSLSNGFICEIDPVYHNVTFVDWDGRIISSQDVIHGSAATAPTAPDREGYIFIGWDADFSIIVSDLVVTALYEQTETPPANFEGDVDNNGIVDMSDISMLFSYLNGGSQLTPEGLANADVNSDGAISVMDISAIYNIVANS